MTTIEPTNNFVLLVNFFGGAGYSERDFVARLQY